MAKAKLLRVRDAVSRIRRVDEALFWRCAATLELASAQFALSVAERAVLDGVMRHYRAEMPLDPAFKLAATAIIDAVKVRTRAGTLDAAIGRRVRRRPLRRRRVPSRVAADTTSRSE